MKKLLLIPFTICILTVTLSFDVTKSSDDIIGEVIWEGEDCDFYIIETKKWYVLIEWYKGRLLEGDKVSGDLHSLGLRYIKNISRSNEEVKIWTEDYWSSKDDCFDWLKENEKCAIEE